MASQIRAKESQDLQSMIKDITLRLLRYCRENGWAGYDPYDALNSRIFRALPFLDFKLSRLILTQGVKRCPINLRPLLLIPKTANPKGIALFLSSLSKLRNLGLADRDEMISLLAEKLLDLRSHNDRYACWGYNFDWQTRTKLVPSGSPNIVCSTFAANALLDAYRELGNPRWLSAASSTAEFILDTLFWREGTSIACFSYTPIQRTLIHNANLFGAALLSRVSRASGQMKFVKPALDAARYSAGKQNEDGSWDYGEMSFQRWIDNFHTGFNLVALRRISKCVGTREFEPNIHRGFVFYRNHFFREDGAANYFHNSTFPIDIHSIAQSIITLAEFRDLGEENLHLAKSVLNWGLKNMWDPRGFFYFQKKRFITIRIPFIRWSEAWMLFALATLLDQNDHPIWPQTGSLCQ